MTRLTSLPPALSPRVRIAVRWSAGICLAVAGVEALVWLWRLDWGAGAVPRSVPFPPFGALFNLIAGVNLLLLPGRTERRRGRRGRRGRPRPPADRCLPWSHPRRRTAFASAPCSGCWP
jgi:hypothetical protein